MRVCVCACLFAKMVAASAPAQALDPAQLQHFKKKERSWISTHAPSSSEHINYTPSEHYIRGLRTMKETIFICIASHQILSWFIINVMQSSAILKLANSAHTCMHACTDACMHIHMVLAHVCPHNALHSSSYYILLSKNTQ